MEAFKSPSISQARPNLTRDDLAFHTSQFDRNGYTIIANALTKAELVTARRLLNEAYESYDPKIDGRKRVEGYRYSANIVNKDPFFAPLIARDEVYSLAQQVLGRDCILSSFNTLEPLKNQGHQRLHRDGGHPPSEKVAAINTLWAADDMEPENGATRVVPGSHLGNDPAAEMEEQAVQLTVPAGHVLVTNTRVVHGASNNPSGRRRRVMHLYYVRGGIPQQTDQKQYLSDQVQTGLSPELRRILALD